MDYLESLEEKRREGELLEQLRHKKQELQQKLEQLKHQSYDIDDRSDRHVDSTDEFSELHRLTDVLHTYRILGVSIHSMSGDLVLRFDPVYRNQYPATDSFCVQISKKGDNYGVGQHNLPPFIPVQQMEADYLETNVTVKEFVDKLNGYLRAYVYRRESLKHCQEKHKDRLTQSADVNLSVTYVNLKLDVGEELPTLDITLQYDICRSLPDSAELRFETTDDSGSKKNYMDKLLSRWKSVLMKENIITAVSYIVGDM